MNLWRLECFVVLAHELHFRIAAERLHLSQPGLSQQIKHLEQSLGVQLITRSPTVTLTEPGRELLPEAMKILEMVDAIVEKISRGSATLKGEIRINYARSIEVSRSFGLVKAFVDGYPSVTVSTQTLWTASSIESLKAGKVDVAFVRLPIVDEPTIETLSLGADAQLLAVSKSHPLADREAVTRAEVADIDLIHWDRNQAPGNFDAVIASFRQGGVSRLGHPQPDQEFRLAAVAAGEGVALVHEFSALQAGQVADIALKPIAPTAPVSEYGIAWVTGPTSNVVRRFVDLVRALNEPRPTD